MAGGAGHPEPDSLQAATGHLLRDQRNYLVTYQCKPQRTIIHSIVHVWSRSIVIISECDYSREQKRRLRRPGGCAKCVRVSLVARLSAAHPCESPQLMPSLRGVHLVRVRQKASSSPILPLDSQIFPQLLSIQRTSADKTAFIKTRRVDQTRTCSLLCPSGTLLPPTCALARPPASFWSKRSPGASVAFSSSESILHLTHCDTAGTVVSFTSNKWVLPPWRKSGSCRSCNP